MWEQIHSNKVRSAWVVALMGVVLVAIGIAVGVALVGDIGGGFFGGLLALIIWLILWMVAVTKGDKIMLALNGAREIEKKDHPQLVNVVEEMTIAGLLPQRPKVYIVDDPSPNAFATGYRPERAAVTVTTGLLKILNRDELQGVVAHEIGHIKNRDITLMTTASIMLGTIVLLAEVGLRVFIYGGRTRRSRSSSSRGGGQAQAVIMILALVLMILAPIMAQLLYFALSRRREYLADASAAMFTRYPEGLASALEKLGGARIAPARESRVTAPMYIVAPPRGAHGAQMSASSLTTTHPPLEQRIRILRSMAGGVGFAKYEEAYRKATGKGVIGSRTLSETGDVAAREPSKDDRSKPAERQRQATNAILWASGYKQIECPCGAKLKIPPKLAGRFSKCPRCKANLPAQAKA